MKELPKENLDGVELLHLAIEASNRQDHGASIAYLKQALDLPQGGLASSHDYAKFSYLLGAEYAQIGLYDRAVEYFTQALGLDPTLHTARFQLGLLYMTQGQVDPALSTLAPLEQLPPDQAFSHLGTGLRLLIQGQVAACREEIVQGMKLNSMSPSPNVALNVDLGKLLQALSVEAQGGAPDAPSGRQADVEADFMMSAYNRNRSVN